MMIDERVGISIVIPVYNSERTLRELVQELCNRFRHHKLFEIFLVNDGSQDASDTICKELCSETNAVKYLNLFRNFGQINALMAGLNHVRGDVVVIMDDDLQNSPEDVSTLIDAIVGGADFAFGIPERFEQSTFRTLGSRVALYTSHFMLEKPSKLITSSFLSLRRSLVDEIVRYKGPYPYLSGLIFRISQNGVNVKVKRDQRKYGSSNYTPLKLLKLWANGFTNFSVIPLRFSLLLGMLASLFGFAITFWIIFASLFVTEYRAGWASTVAAILVLGGLQLFCLGITGEYVGRIFMLLNRSPQFVIKEKLNLEEEEYR